MYEHILSTCRSSGKRKSEKTCKRIAAATVNKFRGKRFNRKRIGCLCEVG